MHHILIGPINLIWPEATLWGRAFFFYDSIETKISLHLVSNKIGNARKMARRKTWKRRNRLESLETSERRGANKFQRSTTRWNSRATDNKTEGKDTTETKKYQTKGIRSPTDDVHQTRRVLISFVCRIFRISVFLSRRSCDWPNVTGLSVATNLHHKNVWRSKKKRRRYFSLRKRVRLIEPNSIVQFEDGL